jgi:hypothetical protein
MHSLIKEIWRYSNNHRQDMEGQLLKVHSTQEALRTFSDGIAHINKGSKQKQPSVSLNSDSRRKKENLPSYARRHSQDKNFEAFSFQVTEYARGKLGDHIEPGDIWVNNMVPCDALYVLIVIIRFRNSNLLHALLKI